MDKVLIFCAFVLLLVLASRIRDTRKKVIFFGDSITRDGVKPRGYITVLHNMLASQSISGYRFIAEGIGGNKIGDLYARADNDVITKSPDLVVVFVGVNDVWHKKTFGGGTGATEFDTTYRKLVAKLKLSSIKTIICTPVAIGEKTNGGNEQDADLDAYCAIIRNIAAEENLPLVDLREFVLGYNLAHNTKNMESGILTVDGVHLNNRGNQLVAERMWDVIKELKWEA